MKLYEVNGTYGSGNTPCTVFVAEGRRQSGNLAKWYVVEGSVCVNCTTNRIDEGTNVEELQDFDAFTTFKPINSLEDLQTAIES